MKLIRRDPGITDESFQKVEDKAWLYLMENKPLGFTLQGCVADCNPPNSLWNPKLLFIEWQLELGDYYHE